MKSILQVCIIMLAVFQMNAQEKNITGIVTADFDGIPIQGVNVIIKGTSSGTQTNMDGKYALEVEEGAIIEYRYIGYKTVTKNVGKNSIIDVALLVVDTSLDEVVIIGYGTTAKQSYTGSASIVTS
ncbi:MAG: carboxypeptidase-like regulatory domain-containing protein, partial [Winogradskyella sp.]